MTLKLHAAWSRRLKMRAEGRKLWDEGKKLWTDSYKVGADRYKLSVAGEKLIADGYALQVKGEDFWEDAVQAAHGNVKMTWTWRTGHGECTLENGDVYDDKTVADEAAE